MKIAGTVSVIMRARFQALANWRYLMSKRILGVLAILSFLGCAGLTVSVDDGEFIFRVDPKTLACNALNQIGLGFDIVDSYCDELP